jgi:hypothetical protein
MERTSSYTPYLLWKIHKTHHMKEGIAAHLIQLAKPIVYKSLLYIPIILLRRKLRRCFHCPFYNYSHSHLCQFRMGLWSFKVP